MVMTRPNLKLFQFSQVTVKARSRMRYTTFSWLILCAGLANAYTDTNIFESNQDEISYQVYGKNIAHLKVTDTSVSFDFETDDEDTRLSTIFYKYTLRYSGTGMVKFGHVQAGHDGRFTIDGLRKGSVFNLTLDSTEEGLHIRNDNFRVRLIPPAPIISVITVTQDYVFLGYHSPTSAKNHNDFYELTHSRVQDVEKVDEIIPFEPETEIKIPPTVGNTFKLFRKRGNYYSVVKIRAHNEAGYSESSMLLLSPFQEY